MNLQALEAQALTATLDNFTVGIVLVDGSANILHANASAREMIRQDSPIQSSRGRLTSVAKTGMVELGRAIALATADETTIGTTGIGISLMRAGEPPAIAHVLPLTSGNLRTRLFPGATAAVFVTSAAGHPRLGASAVAQTFGLTKAESRLLDLLAEGRTLERAAAELGVADTTAKTHLMHIFAKTGVSRQADLMRLIMTLVPPLRGK
jgi:DNA-binding CsgD family transcriptional regulator